jgi:hypothetical protein
LTQEPISAITKQVNLKTSFPGAGIQANVCGTRTVRALRFGFLEIEIAIEIRAF